MSMKNTIDESGLEFYDPDLLQENTIPSNENQEVGLINDLPLSERVFDTAYIPIGSGAKRKCVPFYKTDINIRDLLTPRSYEMPNVELCENIVNDIKKHLITNHSMTLNLLHDYEHENELEQKLNLIETPAPPEILGELKDLKLNEWRILMDRLPTSLFPAIVAYVTNPEAYIKNRQIDLAYKIRSEQKF